MLSKKILGAFVVSCAFALTSCAGTGSVNSSNSSGSDGTNADGSVVLEFYSNHPGSSKELEEKMIAAFEEQNPNIDIKLVDAGKNYEEVQQKFNAALSGGQVPDLVIVSDVTWFNFALNDQLAPVDDLMKGIGADTSDYVQSLYDEYTIGDAHYAVPFARSTPIFYYNKDLFAQAGLPDRGPKDWQEWNDVFAPALKEKLPGVTPLGMPDGTNYFDWYFQGMAWSMGGAYSDGLTMTMSSPKTVEAGNFVQSQFKQGYFVTEKEATAPFVAGQVATIVESTGSLSAVEKDGKVNVGTAFMPAPDGLPGTSAGGSGIAISERSQHKEEAAKFLDFITNTENTVMFAQNTGYMPVRTSAVNDPDMQAYFDENPNFKTAVEQLSRAKKQDAGRVYVQGGGLRIGGALDKIAAGADVEQTFKEVDEESQKIIDRDIAPKMEKLSSGS